MLGNPSPLFLIWLNEVSLFVTTSVHTWITKRLFKSFEVGCCMMSNNQSYLLQITLEWPHFGEKKFVAERYAGSLLQLGRETAFRNINIIIFLQVLHKLPIPKIDDRRFRPLCNIFSISQRFSMGFKSALYGGQPMCKNNLMLPDSLI